MQGFNVRAAVQGDMGLRQQLLSGLLAGGHLPLATHQSHHD